MAFRSKYTSQQVESILDKVNIVNGPLAGLVSPIFQGTPTAPTPPITDSSTRVATTAMVLGAIQSMIAASNALIYKGTIGVAPADVQSLPNPHTVGWTYVVYSEGTYAGYKCEPGDMIICRVAGTTSNNSDWSVVQTNIDGAVTGPTSSIGNHIPIFNGSTGRVIKDSGMLLTDYVLKTTTVNGHPLSSNVTVTKSDVGLGNVDNTSDVNKPISNATKTYVDTQDNAIKASIPTKVSQLSNDAGYITISSVPTKLSQLTNDVGFITSASIPTKLPTPYSLSWSGYNTGSFDGSAAKSFVIPNNTNQLTNGAGFITSSGSCNYATSAGNADTVDNLHATAFARADTYQAVDLNTVNGLGIMCNSANADATLARNYPIQEAGTLFYGTAAYGSANQIYGSFNTNRWFARGGGNAPASKTAWKEFMFAGMNISLLNNNSGYITSLGSCSYATTAGSANTATYATSAGSATSATSAGNADTVDGYHAGVNYAWDCKDIRFPQVNFPKDDPPRANIDPVSLRVWDSYDQSVVGGDSYGTVLEIMARSAHWDTQLYFQGFGGSMYIRSSSYNDTSCTYPWRRIPFESEIPTKTSQLTNDSGFIDITAGGQGNLSKVFVYDLGMISIGTDTTILRTDIMGNIFIVSLKRVDGIGEPLQHVVYADMFGVGYDVNLWNSSTQTYSQVQIVYGRRNGGGGLTARKTTSNGVIQVMSIMAITGAEY